jgi:hypothetical protein
VTGGAPADGRPPRLEYLAALGPGYYGLVRTPGEIPWLIRRATRSRYDHAFITLGDGQIAEAEPGHVRISPIVKYAAARTLAFSTGEQLTDVQRTAVAAKARSLAGAGYNFAAIAEQALADMGWQWRWLVRFAANDHDLDCSQLVAVSGVAAGVTQWLCGKQADQVTPGDLGRLPGVQPA